MPIDASELQSRVNYHLKNLRKFMWLTDWTYNVKVQPINDETVIANCWPDIHYKNAKFTFDPFKFDADDDELILDYCFHEMCHVLSAPFDMFVDAVSKAIPNDSKESAILRVVLHTSNEHFVLNMERMWRYWMKKAYLEYIHTEESPDNDSAPPTNDD